MATASAQYVRAPDGQLVLRDRDADHSGATGSLGKASSGLEERLYVLSDGQGNVGAIADTAGAIKERYLYTPEGARQVLGPTFAPPVTPLATYDWHYGFAGGRLDGVGLWYLGGKVYDPLTGGPLMEDPLAYASNAIEYSEWTARNSEIEMVGGWKATQTVLRVGGTALLTIGTLGLGLVALKFSTVAALGLGTAITAGGAGAGATIGGLWTGDSEGAVTGAEWGMAAVGLVGGVWTSAAKTAMQVVAAKEAAKLAGTTYVSPTLGCRLASGAISGGIGTGIGAGFGFASGFSEGYGRYGTLDAAMAHAIQGAKLGAAVGGLSGLALGLASPFVCFVAGTQVVVGAKVREDDGRIVTISARELARMEDEAGGVAVKLQVVDAVTGNIEDIVERGGGELGDGGGQWLISRDQHDPGGPLVGRRIVRTYKRTAHVLRVLTLRDDRGVEQTQRVTEEHPYGRPDGAWTPACLLAPGDWVRGIGGSLRVLANTAEAHPQGVTVYNLEVEGTHTYFVQALNSDAEPVWVHNARYRNSIQLDAENLEGIGRELFEAAGSERIRQGNFLVTDNAAAARITVITPDGRMTTQTLSAIIKESPMGGPRIHPEIQILDQIAAERGAGNNVVVNAFFSDRSACARICTPRLYAEAAVSGEFPFYFLAPSGDSLNQSVITAGYRLINMSVPERR